ncbi:hypothetical protein HMPREF3034_01653 [Prevotella sp. DNF00663]|nr:hypothetical protein HMPREF3034_01653 [Prevotella sp. DNF00663]
MSTAFFYFETQPFIYPNLVDLAIRQHVNSPCCKDLAVLLHRRFSIVA